MLMELHSIKLQMWLELAHVLHAQMDAQPVHGMAQPKTQKFALPAKTFINLSTQALTPCAQLVVLIMHQ